MSSSEGQFAAASLNGLIDQRLYDQLGRVPGVAQVALFGGSQPAFWLFVDPVKLAANRITAAQQVAAVASQNTVAVGGLVGGPPVGGDRPHPPGQSPASSGCE